MWCVDFQPLILQAKKEFYMIERFVGHDGKRYLIAALESCSIIEHDKDLATRLAEVGELITFDVGDTILSQGGTDNDVYFLLVGQADVLVNNRPIAIRETRETVGEMALLEPTEPRTATITARTPIVALKVTEPSFHEVAREHPRVWKAIAVVVAERLRQRSAFLNLPNTRPVLFLGCSAESLVVAQEIQLGLKHDNIETVPWTNGIFGPSSVTIDALLKMANESDFAAFIFSPDDKLISREKEYTAPRDNVVFELGLFMGRLERNRTFIIKEQKSDLKIPTDLLGITLLTYAYREGIDLAVALGPVCTELRKVVKNLGVR